MEAKLNSIIASYFEQRVTDQDKERLGQDSNAREMIKKYVVQHLNSEASVSEIEPTDESPPSKSVRSRSLSKKSGKSQKVGDRLYRIGKLYE